MWRCLSHNLRSYSEIAADPASSEERADSSDSVPAPAEGQVKIPAMFSEEGRCGVVCIIYAVYHVTYLSRALCINL